MKPTTKPTTKSTTVYLQIFQEIVNIYQEKNESSGDLQAIDYAQGAQSGKASHSSASCIVRPSASDFIADVQIAARNCLAPGELAYWSRYYKTGEVVVVTESDKNEAGCDAWLEAHVMSFPSHLRTAVRSLDSKVREKMGRQFEKVDLHPYSKYVTAVDVRQVKAKDKRVHAAYKDPKSPAYNPFWGSKDSGNVVCIQAAADWRLNRISKSLNTAEASEMLGVRPATLRGWKAQRIGPPFLQLSPRCVRYAEDDILRYANERRVVPSVRETRETS